MRASSSLQKNSSPARILRRGHPAAGTLMAVGIDDLGLPTHRYASIVYNLERRRVATLLPECETATAQALLAAHPTIAIVCRDRGGGQPSPYGGSDVPITFLSNLCGYRRTERG